MIDDSDFRTEDLCRIETQEVSGLLGGAILEPRVEMVLKLLTLPITLFGILVLSGQGKSFVVRGIGLA